MAATRPPKCRSIMSIVASDERLDTLARTLRKTQLEGRLLHVTDLLISGTGHVHSHTAAIVRADLQDRCRVT